MKKSITIIVLIFSLMGCSNKSNNPDASGTFEAEEIIISAQASGIIKTFNVFEGKELKESDTIGYIDTIQLSLKKEQLLAQIKAILSKNPDKAVQLSVLQQQLKQAEYELTRVTNLHNSGAATSKQLDDAKAQVALLNRQTDALASSLSVTTTGLQAETRALQSQIKQIDDQISRSIIVNPVNGTILSTYVRANETAAPAKPLYKIADISTLILRAYITGDQLSEIQLGQAVKVLTDKGKDEYNTHEGKVEWISEKAEFTPKTIQTKDERANLVYAIKVRVPNDGTLKIGMYGEVIFNSAK